MVPTRRMRNSVQCLWACGALSSPECPLLDLLVRLLFQLQEPMALGIFVWGEHQTADKGGTHRSHGTRHSLWFRSHQVLSNVQCSYWEGWRLCADDVQTMQARLLLVLLGIIRCKSHFCYCLVHFMSVPLLLLLGALDVSPTAVTAWCIRCQSPCCYCLMH